MVHGLVAYVGFSAAMGNPMDGSVLCFILSSLLIIEGGKNHIGSSMLLYPHDAPMQLDTAIINKMHSFLWECQSLTA